MNKIHCKQCAKMRRATIFIESVPDKDGKVERVYLELKKVLEYIKNGFIKKLFQRGKIANLCPHCGSITEYTVNAAGKLVTL